MNSSRDEGPFNCGYGVVKVWASPVLGLRVGGDLLGSGVERLPEVEAELLA